MSVSEQGRHSATGHDQAEAVFGNHQFAKVTVAGAVAYYDASYRTLLGFSANSSRRCQDRLESIRPCSQRLNRPLLPKQKSDGLLLSSAIVLDNHHGLNAGEQLEHESRGDIGRRFVPVGEEKEEKGHPHIKEEKGHPHIDSASCWLNLRP